MTTVRKSGKIAHCCSEQFSDLNLLFIWLSSNFFCQQCSDKKFMGTLNIDGEFAPISAQINMLVRDGFGRFSDQAFMSSDLGGSLVLLRGASNKVSAEKLNFIKSAMVQSSVLGHASVVLLDSSSKDESRVISMLNIPEDDSDCMCIFDRRSNQKHCIFSIYYNSLNIFFNNLTLQFNIFRYLK